METAAVTDAGLMLVLELAAAGAVAIIVAIAEDVRMMLDLALRCRRD